MTGSLGIPKQRKLIDEEEGSMPTGPNFKSTARDVLERASFYYLIKGPFKLAIH